RLIRETEAEADRLSVWLLARAGYDPEAAGRFWRRFGQRGLNIFGSPTHGGWRGRLSRFDSEIAIMRAAGPNGRPALLPLVPAG
ncbi:MAG: peptidase M48, Ste24p, partial [Sphingomonas sp.]